MTEVLGYAMNVHALKQDHFHKLKPPPAVGTSVAHMRSFCINDVCMDVIEQQIGQKKLTIIV